MIVDWADIFDNSGAKVVSTTDKNRRAYVPSIAQRKAILASGIKPADCRPAPPFKITILLDANQDTVISGYYHAERSTVADRSPEPRMGQSFISEWLETGDEVFIGNIGPRLFAFKTANASDEKLISELARVVPLDLILAKAELASGTPARRRTTRQEFIRNPYVVLGALERCKNHCETPDCRQVLFKKDNGKFYLEVHHITPLQEGGDDSLINVAALCPHCHRELHHGVGRVALRAKLQSHISAKPLQRAKIR